MTSRHVRPSHYISHLPVHEVRRSHHVTHHSPVHEVRRSHHVTQHSPVREIRTERHVSHHPAPTYASYVSNGSHQSHISGSRRYVTNGSTTSSRSPTERVVSRSPGITTSHYNVPSHTQYTTRNHPVRASYAHHDTIGNHNVIRHSSPVRGIMKNSNHYSGEHNTVRVEKPL